MRARPSLNGPLNWHDAAELAPWRPQEEVAHPVRLLEFIAELAHALQPRSVLDAWVEAPTLLAAANEASGSLKSSGLVRNQNIWSGAQSIEPLLDWRLGDPLMLLRDLSHERFELVLAAPPMGMRISVAPERDDPPGRVDFADLVLWRVAPLMADGGATLFYTSDGFFWQASRRRLWSKYAERGLHPRAVISVDPTLLPSWHVATSLVLFTREARDQLFVGRLARGSSVPALVRNLVAERTDDDPQLGAMTRAEAFRGWGPFVLEQELSRMFR
jgi:hypothetical protein